MNNTLPHFSRFFLGKLRNHSFSIGKLKKQTHKKYYCVYIKETDITFMKYLLLQLNSWT